MQVALHIIREEIFTLVELHGIQKKCRMNDNKTKTETKQFEFFSPKYLSLKLAYKFRACDTNTGRISMCAYKIKQ